MELTKSHAARLLASLLLVMLGVSACADPGNNLRATNKQSSHGETIQLHVVSHTHDDTGWLITVDQYFEQEVRYILDTVVDNLVRDPNRKFNFVEMAFFSRWWEEQSLARRDTVRKLVKEKRLQFLNGGWCMHDEASPLALEMIDQTTRGHQFILREFGEEAAPRVTWQIDPFGHSNTQAWLLAAEAGMPAMFWARMNYDDREKRKIDRELEYIWQGSKSNGANSQILGGELWGQKGSGLYGCPFTFEDYTQAAAMVANPERHDYNMEDWVERTVSVAKEQAANFKTKHIMWAAGFDFTYKNAGTWYESLDKLMKFVNKDGRIKMFYSTPGDYVDALNQDKNATWEIREDDLMPLHEHPHVYWTGYFSSRVALKRLLRRSSSLLQVARQLSFAAGIRSIPASQPHHGPRVGTSWTDAFEAAVAVAMHHDGISGTAKQAVANDYALRVSEGQEQLNRGMAACLRSLTHIPDLMLCPALNISLCEITSGKEHQDFSFVAWNPLSSKQYNHTFAIPVTFSSGTYNVTMNGVAVQVQLTQIDAFTKTIPQLYINSYAMSEEETLSMKNNLFNDATHVLQVQADIPPMQAVVFNVTHVAVSADPDEAQAQKQILAKTVQWHPHHPPHWHPPHWHPQPPSCEEKTYTVESGSFLLEFDGCTTRLIRITNKKAALSAKLSLNWGFYESASGPCAETGCAAGALSGAYLFRPASSKLHSIACAANEQPGNITTTVHRGSIVTEVHQKVAPWVSHVIRLREGTPYVEVEYTVGPIPIEDGKGKEVVLRYTSDLATHGAFATDSNGLELEPRIRDRLPASYPEPRLVEDEPIAGNYYPVNSMISMTESDRAQLTVVTDSTQGGSSLHDGEVELMVHRRVLHDDNKGVVEPLNETMCGCNGANNPTCYCAGLAIRGVHRIVFDSPVQANATRRQVADALHFAPEPFFHKHSADAAASPLKIKHMPSMIASKLPPSIRLLSIVDNYEETLGANTLLIRLQHIYSVDEHSDLSQPVTVELRDLIASRQVLSAYETTLTGNMPVEKKPTYEWLTSTQSKTPSRKPLDHESLSVEIGPMQIRTFVLQLTPLSSEATVTETM